MATEITLRLEALIRSIPRGRVASYSAIAHAAGIPNGARQVARLLHSRAASQDLPWFRVVKKDGSIALPRGEGFEEQRSLLKREGIEVSPAGVIDLERYGCSWEGNPSRDTAARKPRNERSPSSRKA